MYSHIYIYIQDDRSYHSGAEKWSRRMKVVELKYDLLNRAKILKGRKKKKAIFLEN